MTKQTMPNQKTVADISRLILHEVAPEEESLFDLLFELYWVNPVPPDLKQPLFNPMHTASGVPDQLIAVTPAIADVVMKGFSKLTQQTIDYERGIQNLLSQVPRFHRRYEEILIKQGQMQENLDSTRLYGDTPQLQHTRSRILGQLNEISLDILDRSFNSLMGLAERYSKENLDLISKDAIKIGREWGIAEETSVGISKLFINAYLAVAIGNPPPWVREA